MKCDGKLLSRYKDGEVTPRQRREVEAHLSACPYCKATMAAYEHIGRSIAGFSRPRAPASLRGEMFARVARENGRSGGGTFIGTCISGLALAATALVVILVLSTLFGNMGNQQSETLATAVFPPPEAADIPPASTVEVRFNKTMDTKSVEDAVVITPTVAATVAWEGDKLVLKPDSGFAANTSYTVTIETTAKDVQGVPIKDKMVLHFSTGALITAAEIAMPALTQASPPIAITPTLTSVAFTPSPTATLVAFTPSPTATVIGFTPTPTATLVTFIPSPTATSVPSSPSPTQTPTPSPIPTPAIPPPTPSVTATVRIAYVYDPAVGTGYTGDWPIHLRSRGYSVTAVDVGSESGFDLTGYHLIVIGWLSGREPATNTVKIRNVKVPVLNGYSGLAEKLGQGKVYDDTNPGRTLYGKTVKIEGGGSALTAGFSGEVTLANDTLYRVPIAASAAVLATVTDEQQGVRNAPVWTLSDNKVYFGFWYSKDGANHNEAYWTLFDRSVDYLLGRSPSPTPRAG